MDSAEYLIKNQYHIVDDFELSLNKEALHFEQHQAWDSLIADVRKATNGVVRVGHMFWAVSVLEKDNPRYPVPTFLPPNDLPYNVCHDSGVPLFRKYLVSKVDGHLMKAYDYLRCGAEAASPLCMAHYGVACLEGRIPGKSPEPAAIKWLELAIQKGYGEYMLAHQLLDGQFLKQDILGGLSLLDKLVSTGNLTVALELAAIYERGEYGIQRDHQKALYYALSTAPVWRRIAARFGLTQSSWLRKHLRGIDLVKARFKERTPWELQQMNKKMVRNIRARTY